MIQWIALAVAADAETKASEAKKRAIEARNASNEAAGDLFVVVQPFKLETVSSAKKSANFLKKLFSSNKEVLSKKPYAKWSFRRSDIRGMTQNFDDDSNPYVKIETSPGYVDFFIPGTVEEISEILNGINRGRTK